MKYYITGAAMALCGVMALQGCAQPVGSAQGGGCPALGPKALTGALLGAASGAGVGALAGRGKGALIGGLAGLAGGLLIGASIDHNDCVQAQMALNQMRYAPVGQPVMWRNASTGSAGSFTPTSNEFSYNGEMCRRVNVQAQLAGHSATQDSNTLSCRNASGDGDYHTVEMQG